MVIGASKDGEVEDTGKRWEEMEELRSNAHKVTREETDQL